MPPIYATSTYVQQSPGVHKGLDYGRSHNPTRWALERCVADLEGGAQAFAFASGLAAISTVLELLDAGSHIVVRRRRLRRHLPPVRARAHGAAPAIDFSFVDLTDPRSAARRRCGPRRKLVWVETPTNPLLQPGRPARDRRRSAARAASSRVADNTFASPCVQRPLELGFDIVVHSTTKYLNGHSDVIGGIAVVGSERRASRRCASGSASCRTRSARSPARSTASSRCAA